jgi:hypothetical protein
MSQSFSLHVILSNDEPNKEDDVRKLREAMQNKDTCCVTNAGSCRISQQQHNRDALYALLFVPATIVDSVLLDMNSKRLFIYQESEKQMFSDRLLSLIHPFLARNFPLKAVLRHCNAPSDCVLLDLSHTPADTVLDLLEQCHTLHSGPELILQMLLIDRVVCTTPDTPHFDLPTCPVCLYRIDPPRLGWKLPSQEHLCSRFCPPPDFSNPLSGCPKQRFLAPWPRPSCCGACKVIQQYWKHLHHSNNTSHSSKDDNNVACMACDMQQTLWVCLTCAFVGCGRYSNKHAAQHFRDSSHPFCLELTTLRIWDYSHGEGGFAHRVDLLECPSSPPLWTPWIPMAASAAGMAGDEPYNDMSSSFQFDNSNGKAAKKVTMMSEEYEALLQSSLEEQAQHYEGEISRLRAELTTSMMSREALSDLEQAEIDQIIAANDLLRASINSTKNRLLDLQSQEVPLREASNRLLREQQLAQELLAKIQDDNRREREALKLQVDELEQQIADLTTNQRMREQFIQDEELQNAQIFGAVGNVEKKRTGKKTRRFFRK